jgi:hypothetical protein
MSSSVDTQIIQPGRHRRTSGSVSDDITPIGNVDHTVTPAYSDNTSRLSHLYSQCRDVCGDPAGLRIVAASAFVVGLMLASAPAALAQVRLLLVTAPATFTQADPTQAETTQAETTQADTSRDEPVTSTGDSLGDSNVRPRLTIRSVTALIRWDGTREALRCAYGLLFDGSTRSCKRDPIVAASSYRRQLAFAAF